MTTTVEEILAPLATVPPARRPPRRRRRGRRLVPVALAAVVALFVAAQPRAERRSVEASAVPAVAPSHDLGQLAAAAAQSVLGAPYRPGAAGPDAFDTSGLVVWSFDQAGRPGLPHYTGALWSMGPHVPRAQLRPGDLVFFSGLGWVGISLGGDRFVHAAPAGVVVDTLQANAAAYVGAVRVLLDPRRWAIESVLAGPQQLSPVRGTLVRAAGPVTYRVFVANRSTQRIARHVHFSLGGRGQSRFVALGPHSVVAVRFVDRAPKLGTPLILRVWFDDGDSQLVLHVRYRGA